MMTKDKTRIRHLSIFLIWLFNITAVIGISMGQSEWFTDKTPLNMILILITSVLVFPLNTSKKWGLFLFIGAFGIFVEWLGVHYGLIFGDYSYGQNFGPKLDGVPYLIGVNWAILVFITSEISKKISLNYWVRAVIGAALMVFLDLFMEVSAPIFDFWAFDGQVAPLQNYVGWFFVAVFLHLVLLRAKISIHPIFAQHLYASQLAFFVYFFFWHL
ncbi:carotenoid biosynthesis protein [Sungkyunkwania multivorans]|uniref:Carotenoid biosynthesis protein n=1 Tax=Sungkyunkwania multivorans TaxID=1173618 RepID=A0ABW3CVA2_9FLAO